MTITGSGFGTAPLGVPGESVLPFLSFIDQPLDLAQWQAGYAGCGNVDAVTLDYTSWSNTKILISGFGREYGRGPRGRHKWTVSPGDLFTIAVANSGTDGPKMGYTSNPTPFGGPLGTGAVGIGQVAMKLCLERVLPRCDERPVTFALPPLAAVGSGEIAEPSPQKLSRAMNAVTTALACGEITPGEAATIAGVYETFARTAGIAKEKVTQGTLLRS
jgi:hypothetical protein